MIDAKEVFKDISNESLILNTFSVALMKNDADEDFDILESVFGKELLSRLKDGEKAIKQVEIYGEYLDCLNKSNMGAITMAWVHGWRCPQEDIDKGEEFRKRLGINEEGK